MQGRARKIESGCAFLKCSLCLALGSFTCVQNLPHDTFHEQHARAASVTEDLHSSEGGIVDRSGGA